MHGSDDNMMFLIVAFKNIYGYAIGKTTYLGVYEGLANK